MLVAKEPGSDFAMDSITINLDAEDSRLTPNIVDDQTDAIQQVTQATHGPSCSSRIGLVRFDGCVILEGKADNKRRNKERREHAENVLRARLAGKPQPHRIAARCLVLIGRYHHHHPDLSNC